MSPRDTSYKYISFGYLLLLVTLWKVEFSETQRQGLLWLGIQPDNSNSKTCSAWPVLPSVSENPLTSRWRENLHNRSGYVPNVEQRGSLCPLPGPFCMFTKKSDPLPLYAVRHHPPYPSTFLAPYFLITYIYILSASIHSSFLSFSFSFLVLASVSSPPVFLCFSHRSNHLFTYSFIYSPIFISSRTLDNYFGNSANHCFRSLFFPQFVVDSTCWVLYSLRC